MQKNKKMEYSRAKKSSAFYTKSFNLSLPYERLSFKEWFFPDFGTKFVEQV